MLPFAPPPPPPPPPPPKGLPPNPPPPPNYKKPESIKEQRQQSARGVELSAANGGVHPFHGRS